MTDLIEAKTADLSGEALGWAVGVAEGLTLHLEPPIYGNGWRVFAIYRGEVTERCKRYNPWEDWALGGPLLAKHHICLDFQSEKWSALSETWTAFYDSPTAAICLAIVAAKLGETVRVPRELMP
ncbi:DUF2591 domain-containing protein [Pseudomonas parafulva]|uniref:DUF2591 domain-containing protein n=1 Tax=Pseudomonas parafulva TaxID=157782 RepID=A0AAI8KBD3_9PSED|nr:phage protein NinX family protein [Pseudomonas parafulva]AXO88400.1 DUF2591 domain-containing protein [Pseudomonas parafulva]